MPAELLTITEVAGRLDVRPETVSDLLRKHGMQTDRIPHTPNARGISRDQFRRLKRLLTPEAALAS